MKLWQKVFFLTLPLMIFAVNIIPGILLAGNHTATLAAKRDSVKRTSELAENMARRSLENLLTETGQYLLTESQVRDRLADISVSLSDDTYEVSISADMLATLEDSRLYSTIRLIEGPDRKFIYVEKPLLLGGFMYRLMVMDDVSEDFARFDRDIQSVQWLGCGASIAIALILLVALWRMLRPVSVLNAATGRIAGGDYHERVPVKGNNELAQLSDSFNKMAACVEENINQTQQVASQRKLFISNMTHELKTPLTSILGFADILKIKSQVTDDERREYASIISDEANRLRLLSSRLMELVALGEVELALKTEYVCAVVREAVRHLQPLLDKYEVSVVCDLHDCMAPIDRELFLSLVNNLMDNACKVSIGKQVDLRLWAEEGKVYFSVRDYGPGIAPEQLPFVTDAFYMTDKARTRKNGGAGIGLSLCKAIAEAHHGTLSISSTVGEGTVALVVFSAAKDGEKSL